MNNVSKGIFEIDGYEISKDTTVERFKASDKYEILDVTPGSYIVDSRPNAVEFCDKRFCIELIFLDEKLTDFTLSPIELDHSKYDSDEDFNEACFSLCEQLLDSLFDEAHKNISEAAIKYTFDGGRAILAHTFDDGRTTHPGGNIVVRYGDY